jgi:small subunit ribosomal protein S9
MSKIVQSSGKRKRAIARATIKPGKGVVRVNHILLSNYQPRYAQMKIAEPILLAEGVVKDFNIDVTISGGGVTSQADAARLAVARGLAEFAGGDKLKNIYLNYDRQLLVADVRVKETSKPNSHGKARAKRQKSYR